MKYDEEITICQKNVYFAIGKLTELFIEEVANKAVIFTKMNKRRTMNPEDICISYK